MRMNTFIFDPEFIRDVLSTGSKSQDYQPIARSMSCETFSASNLQKAQKNIDTIRKSSFTSSSLCMNCARNDFCSSCNTTAYQRTINAELNTRSCSCEPSDVDQDCIEQHRRSTPITPASLLCYAVVYGDIDLLEKLLITYPCSVNDLDDGGVSAIHLAALDGNAECLTLLHRKGARVNLMDSRGKTPLEYAVGSGQFDAAVYLIENGADSSLVKDGIMF